MISNVDIDEGRIVQFDNEELFIAATRLPFGAYDVGYRDFYFKFDNAKEAKEYVAVLEGSGVVGYHVK